MLFKSRKKDKTINCFPPNYKKNTLSRVLRKNVNNKQLLAEYKDSACLARKAAGGEQRQVRRVCQRGEYPFFRRKYPFLGGIILFLEENTLFQKGISFFSEGNIFRWIITHNSERWISFFQKGIYFYIVFWFLEAKLLRFLGGDL